MDAPSGRRVQIAAAAVVIVVVVAAAVVLSGDDDDDRPVDVEVAASPSDAGEVSGGGSVSSGGTATVSATAASGYEFSHWEIGGSTVSTEGTYSFRPSSDCTVTAVFGIIHDASFTATLSSPSAPADLTLAQKYSAGIASSVFEVEDWRTGEVVYSGEAGPDGSCTVSFDTCRYLLVTHTVEWTDGQTGVSTQDVVVDGSRTNTYKWTYHRTDGQGDVSDALELEIPFSEYAEALSDRTSRANYGHFVSAQGEAFGRAVSHLQSTIASEGLGELDAKGYVLRFVQCIHYSYDSDSTARDEYARYPIETLYEYTGDCEDTAILLASLYEAMGYDTVLIAMTGHMATGVTSESATGGHVLFHGKEYYYCETATDDDFNVGELPEPMPGVVGVYYNDGMSWRPATFDFSFSEC